MLPGFENERLAWLFKKRNLIKKIGTFLHLFSTQMTLMATDKLRTHLKQCKEEEEQFLSLPVSPLLFSRCNGTCTIRSQRALTVQRGIRVLCSKTTGFGVLGSPCTQSKGRVSPEEQPVCLSPAKGHSFGGHCWQHVGLGAPPALERTAEQSKRKIQVSCSQGALLTHQDEDRSAEPAR